MHLMQFQLIKNGNPNSVMEVKQMIYIQNLVLVTISKIGITIFKISAYV